MSQDDDTLPRPKVSDFFSPDEVATLRLIAQHFGGRVVEITDRDGNLLAGTRQPPTVPVTWAEPVPVPGDLSRRGHVIGSRPHDIRKPLPYRD